MISRHGKYIATAWIARKFSSCRNSVEFPWRLVGVFCGFLRGLGEGFGPGAVVCASVFISHPVTITTLRGSDTKLFKESLLSLWTSVCKHWYKSMWKMKTKPNRQQYPCRYKQNIKSYIVKHYASWICFLSKLHDNNTDQTKINFKLLNTFDFLCVSFSIVIRNTFMKVYQRITIRLFTIRNVKELPKSKKIQNKLELWVKSQRIALSHTFNYLPWYCLDLGPIS